MKTVSEAINQMEKSGTKNGIIFSYELGMIPEANVRYGWCTLSSPLYQWITRGVEEIRGLSAYKNPKIINLPQAGNFDSILNATEEY